MPKTRPVYHNDVEACVDQIIETVGKDIVFGMPLALGKPNHLANALYQRAKNNPDIKLRIITALSLEKPKANSDLEKRLLSPIVERIWDGFVEFEYMKDLRNNSLPANVSLSEFFTKAGGYLGVPLAQQNYISTNYTHAVRDLIDNGLNVLGNLIAKRKDEHGTHFSMSCNSDLPLEAFDKLEKEKKKGRKVIFIGQVNSNLPFMYGDAEVKPEQYDVVLDSPEFDFPLFSVPKASVSAADHMIGNYVSALIKDDGSLQIGIGSLGDAIASSLIMRHKNNNDYQELLTDLNVNKRYGSLVGKTGGTGVFEKGLYGATEMLVDVFVELYKEGILKRNVYDHVDIQRLLNDGVISETVTLEVLDALVEHNVIQSPLREEDLSLLQRFGILKKNISLQNGYLSTDTQTFSADLSSKKTRRGASSFLGDTLTNGSLCHGAFFIGPKGFYNSLNQMSETERKQFSMTGVENINQLYGNETLKSLQRKNGRFINAGMMVTLLGAVVSDGLENGSVVSGVGGQYNFVSMAHALECGRLVMMIRSTKQIKGKTSSNIVFNYGHTTIPRHMRDYVVTEYGIADLRGKCDQEVIAELLNIADSRFQDELLNKAKSVGKISKDYTIPKEHRNNTPKHIEQALRPFKARGYFQDFPFGSDFTMEERKLGKALKNLKSNLCTEKYKTATGIAQQFLKKTPQECTPFIKRMKLEKPVSLKEKILQAVVTHALVSVEGK